MCTHGIQEREMEHELDKLTDRHTALRAKVIKLEGELVASKARVTELKGQVESAYKEGVHDQRAGFGARDGATPDYCWKQSRAYAALNKE